MEICVWLELHHNFSLREEQNEYDAETCFHSTGCDARGKQCIRTGYWFPTEMEEETVWALVYNEETLKARPYTKFTV